MTSHKNNNLQGEIEMIFHDADFSRDRLHQRPWAASARRLSRAQQAEFSYKYANDLPDAAGLIVVAIFRGYRSDSCKAVRNWR